MSSVVDKQMERIRRSLAIYDDVHRRLDGGALWEDAISPYRLDISYDSFLAYMQQRIINEAREVVGLAK